MLAVDRETKNKFIMIEQIRQWLKWMSLSNTSNWKLHSSTDWSYEPDGWSKPRNCYKHKKYPYTIINVFNKNPLHITDLVNRFITDYKHGKLIFGQTLYVVSK